MIWKYVRDLVIGSPLPSEDLSEARLDKVRALAALSPDALASVAYANQEIFLGLVVAGAAGLAYQVVALPASQPDCLAAQTGADVSTSPDGENPRDYRYSLSPNPLANTVPRPPG
jgi:hypothetical protein